MGIVGAFPGEKRAVWVCITLHYVGKRRVGERVHLAAMVYAVALLSASDGILYSQLFGADAVRMCVRVRVCVCVA